MELRPVLARIQVGRMGRDEQAEHRGFPESESTLYDTMMMGTFHYVVIQTHRRYDSKSES